jgi:DNA-binding transcriptional MerR regulator
VAGTTVRNIRSYQDRGLIDPPERRGRVGIYTQAHLGRLRLIHHLLARGYTLANIMELLKAIVEGHDLRSILGLETAISSPWNSEAPRHYSYLALARLFGRAISRTALAKAISLGLLEPDGFGYLARSPRALAAGAEMAKPGFRSRTCSTSSSRRAVTSRPCPTGSSAWWCANWTASAKASCRRHPKCRASWMCSGASGHSRWWRWRPR